jgi:hypothetical protein
MIKITDDYGRILSGAPRVAPSPGWVAQAEWAGREGCTPETWFCSSEHEALELLRGLQDFEHAYPPYKVGEEWRFDLTADGCVPSYGRALPVATEHPLVNDEAY